PPFLHSSPNELAVLDNELRLLGPEEGWGSVERRPLHVVIVASVGGLAVALFGGEEEVASLLPGGPAEVQALAEAEVGEQCQVGQPRFFADLAPRRRFLGLVPLDLALRQDRRAEGAVA